MSANRPFVDALQAGLAPWRVRWSGLLPREQRLVRTAAGLVLVAVVWLVAVAPPLRTLRLADTQRRALEVELQTMQDLQAQASLLQSQPTVNRSDALRALDTAVKQTLGATAQLSVGGDRATVTLRGTSGTALAQWLAQVRVNARALPGEARLTKSLPVSAMPAGPAGVSAPPPSPAPAASLASPPEPVWSGTLVLNLPPQ